MAPVRANYALAACVVTGRSIASGPASQVLYSGEGAWLFGGTGRVTFSSKRPKRLFDEDDQEVIAAPERSVCFMSLQNDGTLTLTVPEEQYILTDCEGQ